MYISSVSSEQLGGELKKILKTRKDIQTSRYKPENYPLLSKKETAAEKLL